MIQDIYPHKLNNQYNPEKKPDADSIILYFTKDRLLHRLLKKSDLEEMGQEDLFSPAEMIYTGDGTKLARPALLNEENLFLSFPRFSDFVNDANVNEDTLTYLFSVDDDDYFLLNEVEASDICGIEATKDPQALMNGLVKRFPEAKIVLTLGGDGSVYRDGDTVLRQGIYKVPVVDTTAAGDTFTGYFIGGLQLGEDPKTALEHAAKAAAIAVSRPGAAPSVPNREEVETFEG